MRSRVKFLVSSSVLSVFALALSYIETLIPLELAVPIPGFKLGLSNIVISYVMTVDPLSAFIILLLKVSISSLLFGTPVSFVFSLVGGVLSYSVMLAVCKVFREKVSYFGMSAVGGFFHNLGQLLITMLLYGFNVALAYSTPMLLSGILCGGALGLVLNLFSVRIGSIVKKMF